MQHGYQNFNCLVQKLEDESKYVVWTGMRESEIFATVLWLMMEHRLLTSVFKQMNTICKDVTWIDKHLRNSNNST